MKSFHTVILIFLLFSPFTSPINLHKKKKPQSVSAPPKTHPLDDKIYENTTISLSFPSNSSSNVDLIPTKTNKTAILPPKVVFQSMQYQQDPPKGHSMHLDPSTNPVNSDNSALLANNDSSFQSMYSNYFQNYYENLQNTYPSSDQGPSLLRNPRLNNRFPEPPYQEIQRRALNPYANIAPYQKVFRSRDSNSNCPCQEKRAVFCDCDELDMRHKVLDLPPIVLPIVQPVISSTEMPCREEKEGNDCSCGGGKGMEAFNRNLERKSCKCPCNEEKEMKYYRMGGDDNNYNNNIGRRQKNRGSYENDDYYRGENNDRETNDDYRERNRDDDRRNDYDESSRRKDGDYDDYYERRRYHNDNEDSYNDEGDDYNDDYRENDHRENYHRRHNYNRRNNNSENNENNGNNGNNENNENNDNNDNNEKKDKNGLNVNNANANNANVLAQKNTLNKIDNVYATNVSTTNYNHHIHNYIQGGDFKFKQLELKKNNSNADCPNEEKPLKRIFPDIQIIDTINKQGLLLKSHQNSKSLSIKSTVPKEVINSIISDKNYKELDSEIQERENFTGVLNQGIENTIRDLKKNSHKTHKRL